MSNANAQAVGFVGSSIASLLKLAPYLKDYDIPDTVRVHMDHLNGQVGTHHNVTGGHDVSHDHKSRQHGGVQVQNSGRGH